MIWKKVALLPLVISIWSASMYAQTVDTTYNFVANPSFEEFINCPKYNNQLDYVKKWKNYLYNTSSDYFNSCYIDSIKRLYVLVDSNNHQFHFIDTIQKKLQIFPRLEIDVPLNIFGFQYPKTGKAYVGIITLNNEYTYQEYIQTQLKKTLIAQKKYKITMYVSLADSSIYANDRFRFCVTKEKNAIKTYDKRRKYPQIECNEGIVIHSDTLISDTENWVKISGIYIAQGGEQYLTIGVFKNDMTWWEHRKKIKVKRRFSIKNSSAYYYIDDVSVYEIIEEEE